MYTYEYIKLYIVITIDSYSYIYIELVVFFSRLFPFTRNYVAAHRTTCILMDFTRLRGWIEE